MTEEERWDAEQHRQRPPKLVGICGLKGAGKDTAAQALVDLGYRRLAFADALKREAARLFDLQPDYPAAQKEVPDGNAHGLTPRDVWQKLGAFARSIDENTWVRLALHERNDLFPYVITDVRHHNEERMVHAAGGIVLRIIRPTPDGAPGDVWSTHESEIHVMSLKVDAEIRNDSTIEELHRRVFNAVQGAR